MYRKVGVRGVLKDDGALETGVLLGVVVSEYDLEFDGLAEVPVLVLVVVLAVFLILAEELVAHHLLDLGSDEVKGNLSTDAGLGEEEKH